MENYDSNTLDFFATCFSTFGTSKFQVRVSFLAKRSVEVTLPHLGAVLGVWSKPPNGGMVSANEKHSAGAFHLGVDLAVQPVVAGMPTCQLEYAGYCKQYTHAQVEVNIVPYLWGSKVTS